jgi:DNA-binding CsgD family transcriptional regulator
MSQATANQKPSTAIADAGRPMAVGFGDLFGIVLSVRESAIVKLLSEGMTVKEIALNLKISNKTVEFHSLRARRKIGNLSIAVMTRFAIINGLSELTMPNREITNTKSDSKSTNA